MSTAQPDYAQWGSALERYAAHPEWHDEVEHLVGAFFDRQGCERTPLADRFISALAIDRVVSGSPALPRAQDQTRQVA